MVLAVFWLLYKGRSPLYPPLNFSRSLKNTPELKNRVNYPPQLFKTGQITPLLVLMVVLVVGTTCQPVGPTCQSLLSLSLSISLPVAAHTFLRRSPPTPPSAGRRPRLSQIHAMRARAARRSSATAWGGATTGPLQRRRPASMNCRASTLGAQAAMGLCGRGRFTLPGDGLGVGGFGGLADGAHRRTATPELGRRG